LLWLALASVLVVGAAGTPERVPGSWEEGPENGIDDDMAAVSLSWSVPQRSKED
jgi:hypothetical protein